jgi:uncharacterized protein DUF6332
VVPRQDVGSLRRHRGWSRSSPRPFGALTDRIDLPRDSAAVVYGAVAGPALLFELPDVMETMLLRGGLVIAPVLFLARVISVLVRYQRVSLPQPSHPGRTSPDS